MTQIRFFTTCIVTLLSTALVAQDAGTRLDPWTDGSVQSSTPPQAGFGRQTQRGVYKTRIVPNWFDANDRFWYRNDLRGGAVEYILVDATNGERGRAFDHQRLADALREAGVQNISADRLQLDALEFDTQAGTILFLAAERDWQYDLGTYELSQVEARETEGDAMGSLEALQDIPRASTRTGPETELLFVNQTDIEVELFWLDSGGQRRSYGRIEARGERRQHTYAGHVWLVVDNSGRALAVFQARERPDNAVISERQAQRPQRPRRQRLRGPQLRATSPDGNWHALIKEGNVYVRKKDSDQEVQLSTDGSPEYEYQMPQWSPDSRTLIAFRVDPGERKEVFLIESSPRSGGRAVLHQRPYALPGDKFASYQLNLFRSDLPEGQVSAASLPDEDATPAWRTIQPDVVPVDFGRPRVRWKSDGSTFTYPKIDRGHQRYRLVEIDARSGNSRNIVDEHTDTFIWTAHTENVDLRPVTWLEETDEIIYASEIDGWRHLYLIDPTVGSRDATEEREPQVAFGGKQLFAPGLKNQITTGQFVVRGVERIDEDNRQIWFRASGMNANQDPYFVHHYRIDFDGGGLVALTGGNGNHSIQFSPDRRFIIATYSRVDMPPVHELRSVQDGQLVCQLEEADASALEESGWQSPEVFVAKGRDGKTDIWGVIYRPRDFDPDGQYPIIEDIYAGPHGSFVPKNFSSRERYRTLNELGFIVVKIDGMGTANRSKTFHDVCWHDLKDAGFPDRILWMQAAATKYAYLDLNRVGVYGVSAGGQSAAGALLFHGDCYKVAVAGCGCHDNRMDKASWNEQWMGYPVGPQYSKSSNIDNAHRLQGKLLLIVGEMDNNVPPESTMRLVDALVKADKDFDLLIVPGAGHGIGGSYGQRRMHDFFARHLLEEPEH